MADPNTKQFTRELTKTVNGQLIDSSIRHAHYIASLEGQVANRTLSFLNDELIPDMKRRLERQMARYATKRPTGTWTMRQLNELTAGYVKTLQAGVLEAGEAVKSELKALAIGEAEWNRAILSGVMEPYIDWTPNLPSVNTLDKLVDSRPFQGKSVGKWFNDLAGDVQDEFVKQIKLGVAGGETPKQITSRILKSADYPARHTKTLVRTAVNHIANEASMATFAENKDVVKLWRFVATLDSRTTDICASYDNLTFNVGEGPYPPLHHQCRSKEAPVTKSWAELGLSGFGLKEISERQRAALGGPVSGKVNYPEWLKGQSLKIKQLRMGKKWGKRFHDKEVTWEDYLYRKGGPKAQFKNAPKSAKWTPNPRKADVVEKRQAILSKAAVQHRRRTAVVREHYREVRERTFQVREHYRRMAKAADRAFLRRIRKLRLGE